MFKKLIVLSLASASVLRMRIGPTCTTRIKNFLSIKGKFFKKGIVEVGVWDGFK